MKKKYCMMNRFVCLLLAVLLPLLTLAACAESTPEDILEEAFRIIKVAETSGAVNVLRGEDEFGAYVGMNLQSGDSVSVGGDGALTLMLDSDKFIYAEPDTCFSLSATGDDKKSQTTIELLSGAIVNRIDNTLGDGSEYVVNTPKATMAVRGTIFRVSVEVDDGGAYRTTIQTLDGVVESELLDRIGDERNERIQIKPGQQIIIITDPNEETGSDPAEDGDSWYVYGEGKTGEIDELPDRIAELLRELEENGEIELSDEVIVIIGVTTSTATTTTATTTLTTATTATTTATTTVRYTAPPTTLATTTTTTTATTTTQATTTTTLNDPTYADGYEYGNQVGREVGIDMAQSGIIESMTDVEVPDPLEYYNGDVQPFGEGDEYCQGYLDGFIDGFYEGLDNAGSTSTTTGTTTTETTVSSTDATTTTTEATTSTMTTSTTITSAATTTTTTAPTTTSTTVATTTTTTTTTTPTTTTTTTTTAPTTTSTTTTTAPTTTTTTITTAPTTTTTTTTTAPTTTTTTTTAAPTYEQGYTLGYSVGMSVGEDYAGTAELESGTDISSYNNPEEYYNGVVQPFDEENEYCLGYIKGFDDGFAAGSQPQ